MKNFEKYLVYFVLFVGGGVMLIYGLGKFFLTNYDSTIADKFIGLAMMICGIMVLFMTLIVKYLSEIAKNTRKKDE